MRPQSHLLHRLDHLHVVCSESCLGALCFFPCHLRGSEHHGMSFTTRRTRPCRRQAQFAYGIADLVWSVDRATGRPTVTPIPSLAPTPPPAGLDGWDRPFWTPQTMGVPTMIDISLGPGIKNMRSVASRRVVQDDVLRTGKTSSTGFSVDVRLEGRVELPVYHLPRRRPPACLLPCH